MADLDSHPQRHVQTALLRELRETIEKFRGTEWEGTYLDVIGALECVKHDVLIEYAAELKDQADKDPDEPTE